MLLVAMALAGAWLGCDKSDDGEKAAKDQSDDDGSSGKKKSKKKKSADEDEGNGEDETAPAKKSKEAKIGDEPTVQPAVGGRSSVPTIDEWNAVTKEVAVRGSSALNCETKMVREWLRVSCRGKNDSGGEPTGVTLQSGGGRGDDFVFTGNGVASLVVRFVEGVDLKANFTWTDKRHTLHVFWPRGAPEPPPKGTFSGY
jgi:hypothetical protein